MASMASMAQEVAEGWLDAPWSPLAMLLRHAAPFSEPRSAVKFADLKSPGVLLRSLRHAENNNNFMRALSHFRWT